MQSPGEDKPLIQVAVQHDYFHNQQAAKIWTYQPSSATQRLLSQMGFRFQVTDQGFNLWLIENKKEALTLFLKKSEVLSLSFELHAQYNYWLNISELPFHLLTSASVLYFTNREDKIKGLSQSTHVTSQDVYQLSTTPFGGSASRILLQNIDKGEPLLISQENTNSTALTSAKESKPYIYYSSKSGNKPIGWIQIDISKEIKEAWLKALSWYEPFPSFQFTLHFLMRRTYWRYWLILRDKKKREKIHKITIETGDPDIEFQGPEEYELGNEQWAYCFISKRLLPILERSPFRFEAIIRYQKNISAVDYEGKKYEYTQRLLPVPKPSSVFSENREGIAVVFSDIHIYL